MLGEGGDGGVMKAAAHIELDILAGVVTTNGDVGQLADCLY